MAKSTPLAIVKDKFGDKSKLVEAIQKLTEGGLWVARTSEDKGLAYVSNSKLLRLLATFTEVKEKFGTREKLVDAVLELEKRSKDAGLRQKISAWPVPRLYDAYKSAKKRATHAAKPAPAKDGPKDGKKAAKTAAHGKVDKPAKSAKKAKI